MAIGLELAIILSTNQPLLPLIAKMTEKANEAVLFFIIRDFDRGGHARSTKTLFGDSIPWGEDFSMRSNSIVAVLVVFFGTILWALVKDTYLSIALEEVTQRAADYLRIPKADMIASATPYVLSIGVVTVAAIAAFKLGERERKSFQAAPNIDPRLAFQRILQHRSWLKRNAENDPEKRKRLTTDYLEIRLDEQMHAALAQDKIFACGQKSQPVTDGPFDRIAASKWHEIEISFLPFDMHTRAYAIYRRPDRTIAQRIAYVGLKLNAAQVAKEFSLSPKVFQ